MTKKIFFSSVLILLLVMVSACSSLSASAAPSAAADAANDDLTGNLGIGILLLEGSEAQVTADQAKEMLLLWKGVKLLTSDRSSSTIELAALYEQIRENLTADQLSSIREVSYIQQEVDQLMLKYASGSVTVAAVKKTTSSSSSNSSMGGPGGGMGGPGGDMAVISGMSAGTTGTSSSTVTSAQAMAIAASKSSSNSAGLNAQLADAVIAILQQRANG